MPYYRRFLLPISTCVRYSRRGGGTFHYLHVYVFGVLVAAIHLDRPR